MLVKISDIKIKPGRRDAKPKAVSELARSIQAVGLLNPIIVNGDNSLIAGLHRLEAAKLLGWTEIECTVSSMDGLQAELAEIDENFVRTNLSHRELGDLLLHRKELYEAIHPETRQGQRNGQTSKNENFALLGAKSFAQDTADRLGMGKRTVEQLVGRGMIADFAIHQPDKEDNGIPNPHFHILCPIRPIEADGNWATCSYTERNSMKPSTRKPVRA